ncbi:M18 family aminopeptidase [Paenarthrobacter aurescens]|uniref:M18 family aminopeptidase n=1 Tax=Paenarthrobacter aurescens TaxID=43663 RepID=A0A4Y3NI12_PAEAU|nr:M18 family aminopeptidase [Paenarthrobacter aurescens]MDO6141654.1 M18 family aminopeptidase [Paenarthrobacter aurescens]MDO6149417.1 M18 family aminopeptidase [Paenarthrobacter aurescens]MDO6156703.1 M18 family aminopeptidase [Paenarthrobacter aurescens]MDO6160689.1 M18 family aminopeptidase [Paenarthrobacter aurescens]GEB18698.1 M18 family aminopeptidase [Paenarthrobacter aurescens]
MPSNASAAIDHIKDLGAYVSASPSSFHAVHEAARRLDAAGFTGLDELQPWDGGAGKFYVIRDGALIAWVTPEGAGPTTAFNILGAHTDSPSFKLKPKPTTGKFGWLQAGVEVYGGPLLNSWLDRELQLAGRLVLRDGTEHLTATGPLLRFPQLAIHLDRGVNDNGLHLSKQQHMNPIFGQGDPAGEDLLALLASRVEGAAVDAEDIGGYDVVIADTQEPAVFGAKGEFFASGRLDNLSSTHAGLVALIAHAAAAPATGPIAVLAAFDHEEIGSNSRSGACGPILEDVLVRISDGLGASVSQRRQALAASFCVSADAGHAVHPNYAEKHDPANKPVLNGGPLLKINANQRYATDATGAAFWARLCDESGVPYQEYVSNNDLPCGSTIGPLTATRLGIRTVDVGIPLLSMHSARELCGVADARSLSSVIEHFFSTAA